MYLHIAITSLVCWFLSYNFYENNFAYSEACIVIFGINYNTIFAIFKILF